MPTMSEVPSPIDITSWPQVVALGLLLAFMSVPAIIGYLSTSRNARGAQQQATVAAEAAGEIKTSLTENNGGKSVKDYLDRIEQRQIDQGEQLADHGTRLGALESATITEETFDAPNP